MTYKLPILIRQIKYRIKDNRPRMFLLSMYYLISALKGTFCILEREKGIGIPSARIDRHELAFVKFIKACYGEGEYSIVFCKGGRGGFRLFWRGIIKEDRFIRMHGHISPYLLTHSPVHVWHDIKSKDVNTIEYNSND